jgi:pilus assembly protein CpaB
MNRKMVMILLLAVVCGLGAMYASSLMLGGGAQTSSAETQEILVAASDLNTEEILKPELVKLVAVPKVSVPMGSFTTFKDVEERWVQIKILEGEPIVDRKLAPKGSPAGLVARIAQGKRAFALNVNEQSGVSGFILPDHHVDVIQPRAPTSGLPGEQPTAEIVLEDLLVLASGTTFQNPSDRSIQSKTVTVAVTPEEASILTAAQSKGQLSLSLRGLNDRGRSPVIPKTPIPKLVVAAPLKVEPKPEPKPVAPTPVVEAAPPPSPARHITIYRGGRPSERIRVDQPGDFEADDPGDGFPTASALFQDKSIGGRPANAALRGPR